VEYVDKRIETSITEDPIVSTPLSTSDSLFSQKGSSEGNCQDRYAAHKKTKKRRVNLKSELDHYLEEDVMPDIKQFDILDFWKKDFKYPTLRMIARDVLAIPVSTVASESAFSMGGRVVSQHRSRLHAKTVEALMCLQNWMIGETVRGNVCFSISFFKFNSKCSIGHAFLQLLNWRVHLLFLLSSMILILMGGS